MKIGLKRIVLLIILAITVYVSYVAIDIYSYGQIRESEHADAAIVLGAAVWGDSPSPVFEERIKHGIYLYENDFVKKLIFTGGKGEGSELSESSIARDYAVVRGVAKEDIFIEEKSKITEENIYFAKEITDINKIESVLLVSDPLHMKRSMKIAKDYGLDAYPSPTPTTKYTKLKTKLPFLFREVFYYVGYKIVK